MTRHAHPAQPPLHIDTLDAFGGATIGMSQCPGRRFPGEPPNDLPCDLAAIEQWGASTLLSLVETHEFVRMGVPDFADAVARTRLAWLHVPIADMRTPGATALAAWQRHRGSLRAAFERGDKVLVHCAFGLGRTGMLVARLLVDAGLEPGAAIARVRKARPGTIETAAQAAFVAHDRLFSLRE
jgi:protein-tyrosine phosphatase